MEDAMKQSNFAHGQPGSACIWMQAGVVDNKPCFRQFHCEQCRFDQAMTRVCRDNRAARELSQRQTKRSATFIFWQDKLNKQPLSQRPCIHHMKGRIDFKTCPKAYHCIDCEFDQFFQDRFKVYARVEQVKFNEIMGFSLPGGYYLGTGHTWVKLQGNDMVIMGIDDFASRLLGRFDTFFAPLMGKPLLRGEAAFTLGREKNKMTFLSPLSGVVTEINTDIRNRPGTITHRPYTDGWILALHCPDLNTEIRELMFMETATTFMEDAAKGLYDFIEQQTGLKAADGGELVRDIYKNLPQVSWEELVNRFLS